VSWTLAGVAIDTGLHGYELSTKISTGLSIAVVTACQNDWIPRRTKAELVGGDAAVKALALEPWLDQACDPKNPPPTDPIAAAVWIGINSAKLDMDLLP
jgi:hypothetical protein